MQTTQHDKDGLPISIYAGFVGAGIAWITAANFFPFWTITLTAAVVAAVRTVLWLRR